MVGSKSLRLSVCALVAFCPLVLTRSIAAQPVEPSRPPPESPVDTLGDDGLPVKQVPPPPPAATPEETKEAPHSTSLKAEDMGVLSISLGLRGMAQDVRGTDRDGLIGGAGVGGWVFVHANVDNIAIRLESRTHLGGSGAGLDGIYTGDVSFGARLGVARAFAFIGRLGASGQILGNDRLLWWTLALPEGDVGAQVGHGRLFLEITALGGLTLGGNYLAGEDGQRKIGTAPHLGMRGTLGLQPLVATVAWRHILERQNAPETSLDAVEGGLCAIFGKYLGVMLCADARLLRGTMGGYGNAGFTDSLIHYGGLSFSVGAQVAGSGSGAVF